MRSFATRAFGLFCVVFSGLLNSVLNCRDFFGRADLTDRGASFASLCPPTRTARPASFGLNQRLLFYFRIILRAE